MVATVSTETLKPSTSESKKSKKKIVKQNIENNNHNIDNDVELVVTKIKRISSSSETESASTGDESSTDTG